MTDQYLSWKFTIVLVMVLALALASPVSGGKIQLTEGAVVELKFDGNLDISSEKYSKNQTISVKLAQPIVIGGLVIVEAGALGRAEVTVCEKAGRPGKPGKLQLKFVDLGTKGSYKLLDEEVIALKGEIPKITGKGRKFLSYLLGFGLLIKGGNAELTVDTIYTATVAETVMLTSD